jgi:hypothetical protein
MSKKINQLDAATDTESLNDSWVLAQADPTNGIAKKVTVAQLKEAYGTKKYTYTASGLEGNTLTIPTIAGKQVLIIGRGLGFIYETGSSPESDEYTWDDVNLVLGAVTNPGERFLILYRNY